MEELDIIISQEQGRVPVAVFHLKGRLNLGTAEQLQAKAQSAVESGARYVLLDLGDVLSVTSAGLRVLHQMYQMLRGDSPAEGAPRSPYLKLLNPTPDVRRVLHIAGFDMFLEVHDNLKDAIMSF